jgi:hypothetical protein
MGLRNDPSKGLQGEMNYQVVATGNRTVAFTCGILSAGLVACSSRLAPAESEGHSKASSHQLLPSRNANGAATHTLRQ